MPLIVVLLIVGVIAFVNASRRKKPRRNDRDSPSSRNDEEWGHENEHSRHESSDHGHGHDGDGE